MDRLKNSILQNIHDEMVKGTFNDLDIVCENGTTSANRLVLAAMSSYFRAMLTSDMTESRTGIFNLPTVTVSVFQDILKMSLCSVDLVNEDNCIKMLDACEMMQLDDVKDLCHRYLKKSLVINADNCLHWWRLLNRYNVPDLSSRAFSYLTENLTDFLQTENTGHLSKTELLEILSKNDLKCKEDVIMKSVMKWLETNNPDADDVKHIFEMIRINIVDPKFLVANVVFSKFIFENNSVQEMIQNVLCSHLITTGSISRFDSQVENVFILHYNETKKTTSLLSCFTSEGTWEDVPPAPVDPGSWYSAASLGNTIYITGGKSRRKCTLVYDVCRREWKTGPDLEEQRYDHCMATANYKVYAIGGEYSNTIEEMGESGTRWQVVGDLKQNRQDAFAATVGHNILVMGGLSGGSGSDVIQCFNTVTRCVSILSSRLPYSSVCLRGSVHLPDVYLLDYDRNMMHVQVTDSDGEIKIQVKSTAKWRSFKHWFGVSWQNGSLLSFSGCDTKCEIRKYNMAEGKEENITFIKSTRSGHVYGVLPVSHNA
ncbi:ectoderm-neural cortex protein 1-like [Gigantopelta aegis]|uniref:ectoderm-neural cortex protein 1-like n=1 Tax=Gigantopelta aegis TaxID=1735272 RepID=UPI001B88AC3E|nr:ectoderm-neural cortex protein 1-like [Gigantopelta aegis]